MKKLSFFVKRFFCSLLATLCMLLPNFGTIAVEAAAEGTDTTHFVPVEETDITKADALEILGMTEAEADNIQIYVSDIPLSSKSSALNPGDTPFDSGYFSFSGTNVGSYRTMNGSVLAYNILWKPTQHLSYGVPTLEAYLYAYDGHVGYLDRVLLNTAITNPTMVGDYYSTGTRTVRIQKGMDYNFVYESYHAYYNGYESKDSSCSIRVIMAVDG